MAGVLHQSDSTVREDAVSAGRGHIPALDGLRGLAILLVMLYHQTVIELDSSLDRAWFNVVSFGWAGVDLFFVLSGFLITGILLGTKSGPGYFRNFYARRTLRIFPLYYAVLVLSFFVIPNLGPLFDSPLVAEKLARFSRVGEGEAWWYWAYLSNFAIALAGKFEHGILSVTWSLAIEEQFYLLWPLVVWACSPRTLARVCLGLMLCSFAVRVGMTVSGQNPIVTYVLTPARLDGLVFGAWVATVARSGPGLAAMRPLAIRLILGAFPLIVILSLIDRAFGWNRSHGFSGVENWNGPLMLMAAPMLLALGFGGILILVVNASAESVASRFFVSRPMRVLGKYSYALYLFHLPIRGVIRDVIYGPNSPAVNPKFRFAEFMGSDLPGQLLFYVVSTLATLVAAWLSWNLYEKYFLKLKGRFEYAHRAAPSATPAPQPPPPKVQVFVVAPADQARAAGS